jgi:hypothetical protein
LLRAEIPAELGYLHMDQKFAAFVETLAPKLTQLLAMPPLHYSELPVQMPLSGVYLFSEGQKHLYVGRSNDLRSRYGRHCRPGATHRQAAFAFQLARHQTGMTVASYKPGSGSREGLMEQPEFLEAFVSAKARIHQMDYRYVAESDQTCQALLEIYCSVALSTPFNDFGTH